MNFQVLNHLSVFYTHLRLIYHNDLCIRDRYKVYHRLFLYDGNGECVGWHTRYAV